MCIQQIPDTYAGTSHFGLARKVDSSSDEEGTVFSAKIHASLRIVQPANCCSHAHVCVSRLIVGTRWNGRADREHLCPLGPVDACAH